VKAFTLSKDAERDLDSIARYLREKFRQDLTADAVKFWSVFSYLIVYDPARRPVEIVRVLHGRRDIGRILT
jgi:plasmid stabilization system protein ParE